MAELRTETKYIGAKTVPVESYTELQTLKTEAAKAAPISEPAPEPTKTTTNGAKKTTTTTDAARLGEVMAAAAEAVVTTRAEKMIEIAKATAAPVTKIAAPAPVTEEQKAVELATEYGIGIQAARETVAAHPEEYGITPVVTAPVLTDLTTEQKKLFGGYEPTGPGAYKLPGMETYEPISVLEERKAELQRTADQSAWEDYIAASEAFNDKWGKYLVETDKGPKYQVRTDRQFKQINKDQAALQQQMADLSFVDEKGIHVAVALGAGITEAALMFLGVTREDIDNAQDYLVALEVFEKQRAEAKEQREALDELALYATLSAKTAGEYMTEWGIGASPDIQTAAKEAAATKYDIIAALKAGVAPSVILAAGFSREQIDTAQEWAGLTEPTGVHAGYGLGESMLEIVKSPDFVPTFDMFKALHPEMGWKEQKTEYEKLYGEFETRYGATGLPIYAYTTEPTVLPKMEYIHPAPVSLGTFQTEFLDAVKETAPTMADIEKVWSTMGVTTYTKEQWLEKEINKWKTEMNLISAQKYEELYGAGTRWASAGTDVLSQLVFVPARAMHPEVELKDIRGWEWGVGGVQLALLAAPLWVPPVTRAVGPTVSRITAPITGAIGKLPGVRGIVAGYRTASAAEVTAAISRVESTAAQIAKGREILPTLKPGTSAYTRALQQMKLAEAEFSAASDVMTDVVFRMRLTAPVTPELDMAAIRLSTAEANLAQARVGLSRLTSTSPVKQIIGAQDAIRLASDEYIAASRAYMELVAVVPPTPEFAGGTLTSRGGTIQTARYPVSPEVARLQPVTELYAQQMTLGRQIPLETYGKIFAEPGYGGYITGIEAPFYAEAPSWIKPPSGIWQPGLPKLEYPPLGEVGPVYGEFTPGYLGRGTPMWTAVKGIVPEEELWAPFKFVTPRPWPPLVAPVGAPGVGTATMPTTATMTEEAVARQLAALGYEFPTVYAVSRPLPGIEYVVGPVPFPTPITTPVPAPFPVPTPAPIPSPITTPIPTPITTPVPAPTPIPITAPVPIPPLIPVPIPTPTPIPTPIPEPVPAPSPIPIPPIPFLIPPPEMPPPVPPVEVPPEEIPPPFFWPLFPGAPSLTTSGGAGIRRPGRALERMFGIQPGAVMVMPGLPTGEAVSRMAKAITVGDVERMPELIVKERKKITRPIRLRTGRAAPQAKKILTKRKIL